MKETVRFRWVRYTVTGLSLVNALSVFFEKLWTGGSRLTHLLDDPSTLVRLWAAVALLGILGLIMATRAIRDHMDLFADMEDERRSLPFELAAGMVQLIVGLSGAIVLAVLS